NPNLLKTTTKLKQSSAIGPACTDPFHSRQRFSQAGLAEAHAYHHTAPRVALRIESANATSCQLILATLICSNFSPRRATLLTLAFKMSRGQNDFLSSFSWFCL